MLLHKFPKLNKLKTFAKLTKEGRLTFTRAYNLILVHASLSLNLTKPLGKPYILFIEPTNICNLKCPMCPTGNGTLKRPKGFMSFDTFKKTVDELDDYLISIVLMNYGEPFLNKEAYKMIRYAKDKNINVLTSTNGHFFDSKKDAEELVKSGIDAITIALDGATAKTNSRYRKNSDFGQIMRSIRNVVEARKRLKKKNPQIKIQFIIMKHNEHELDMLRKLSKDLGVDVLSIKTVRVNSKEEAEEFMPHNKKWQRYDLSKGDLSERMKVKNECPMLWKSTLVNWDGSVVPCCNDPHGSINLGSLKKNSITDIWVGKKYVGLRKQVLKDRSRIPICSNCFSDKDISVEERFDS